MRKGPAQGPAQKNNFSKESTTAQKITAYPMAWKRLSHANERGSHRVVSEALSHTLSWHVTMIIFHQNPYAQRVLVISDVMTRPLSMPLSDNFHSLLQRLKEGYFSAWKAGTFDGWVVGTQTIRVSSFFSLCGSLCGSLTHPARLERASFGVICTFFLDEIQLALVFWYFW